MIDRICLLVNYNLYESKRHFVQGLIQALNRREIETKVIDVQETPLDSRGIASIQAFDPQLTCSFNTFLPTRENLYLWDIIQVPHLYIHVDPALYASHLTRSPYIIISCVDRKDTAALRSESFPRAFFLPHAIERGIAYEENKERPLDVVFLGSCYDYETLSEMWKKDFTPEQIAFLKDAVERVLADNSTSIADALVQAWSAAKLDSRTIDFITMYKYIDYYSRGKDRVDLIRSIKNTKVHVFGDVAPDIPACKKGWSHYLKDQSNVVIHPAVNFSESLEILKQAKVCLNSNPFFKEGSHERILYAYACGALPLTSDNLWVREEFIDGTDIILYQHDALDKVEVKLQPFLENENKRRAAVNLGKDKVLKKHTWDNRVEEIIATLKDVTE